MSFKADLGAFINPPAASGDDAPATDKRNELKHQIFTNGRTIILAGFVALLVWNATKQVLSGEHLKEIADLVKIYLIIEGIVHLVTIIGNMVIKVMEMKAFMLDGKLDDNETSILRGEVGGKETATATVSVTSK